MCQQRDTIMSEFTNINSSCTKNYLRPAKEVAQIAQCSESYVLKIRNGSREDNSAKARLVREIDQITYEGTNKLIESIKQLVKL